MAPGVDDDEPRRAPRDYGVVRHLAEDVQQLKTRVDDLSLRLVMVEQADRRFEDRVESVKNAITTQMTALATSFAEDRADRKSERTWLFRTIAGAVILAVATFVMSGGLKMIGNTFIGG